MCQDIPTGVVVAGMSWEERIVLFWLNLWPTPQVGTQTLHHYWDQEPLGRQVIGHRGEPTNIILLNGHDIKLTPRHLFLSS